MSLLFIKNELVLIDKLQVQLSHILKKNDYMFYTSYQNIYIFVIDTPYQNIQKRATLIFYMFNHHLKFFYKEKKNQQNSLHGMIVRRNLA